MQNIGIMAGGGQFPFLVARAAKERGARVFAVGFKGHTDPALEKECDGFLCIPLGQLGKLIAFFKRNQVKTACMAGPINKPNAMELKPDLRAARLIFRLAGNRGDDAILRALSSELADEGIEVVRPETLVPGLVIEQSGLLAGPEPSAEGWQDIRFGWEKAKILGAQDIGQGIVVHRQVVVAVEAIEGTDTLIERAGSLAPGNLVFVKVFKPGQDDRIDKPALGSKTIALLARHRFTALAFEAGKTLFFDRDEAFRQAATHGISVVGVPEKAEEFLQGKIEG
jgi:Uncharacterized protein conserved in bacteria